MVEKASFSFERSFNELEAFQIGPLGEAQGCDWSYKSKGAITGIMITCDSYAVVSFDLRGFDEHGNTEYSDTFGFHGKKVFKIMLDWPREYFTSLSGTFYLGSKKGYYFSSICFHTNRQKYGPFGYNNGSPFYFPMNGRVIAGFYGCIFNETWIHGTLGVYVKHSTDIFGPSSQAQVLKPKSKVQVIRSNFNQEECIKVGPWGWSRSTREKEWSFMLKAATKINIGYNGDNIKWISFKSCDENVEVNTNLQKSDSTGEEHKEISLNWPEEYLISISLTLRDSTKDLESLCFFSNRKIYGPFGQATSVYPFRFYMKGGIIVGFHGRVGEYFDGLGVYIKPFSELFGSSGQGKIENTIVKAGQFGGQGGKEWNYMPNGAITEIKISHGLIVDSLSFKSVDTNGKSKYSDRVGGKGGDIDLITIDWPEEYLTSISGTHHTVEKQQVIESLCFHTNKMKYGPYGRTQGSPFDLPLKDGVVVGFHGRASEYIDAIGVYQDGPSR